jgi:hypothetical protein
MSSGAVNEWIKNNQTRITCIANLIQCSHGLIAQVGIWDVAWLDFINWLICTAKQ